MNLGDKNPAAPVGPGGTAKYSRARQSDGRSVGRPFVKGRSGNPAGRPRGAKNKLPNGFLDDMLAVWRTHGRAGIEVLATRRPADFVLVAAKIAGRCSDHLEPDPFDRLSDDEVDALIATARGQLDR